MSAASVRDLERIDFVTRHFRDLQGLRAALIGSFGLALVLLSMAKPLGIFARAISMAGLAGLVVGLVVLHRRLDSWYSDRFGDIEPLAALQRPGRSATLRWVLLLIAGGGIWMAFSIRNGSAPLASNVVSCVGWGILLIRTWVQRERRLDQAHYLALGCVVIGLSVEELASGRVLVPTTISGLPLLLISTTNVVTGLFDHLVLVRVVRQLAPEPGAAAGAVIEAGGAMEESEVQR